MSDTFEAEITHLDNETFELVRHIAGKALHDDERVDLEGTDPRGVETALWLAAHDAAAGLYYTPEGVDRDE